MLAAAYLLFRALSVKLFPVLLLPFAEGLALEFEPMSRTQETIQQSISHGGILTEISMPMSDRELAGNQRGAASMTIVDQLQQVEALGLS
jgi:hypothetical protein